MLATRDASGWKLHEGITEENLTAVWGDGQGMVWVVGANSTVLKWNGVGFHPETTPTESDDLEDVQGTGPNDVWIVGQDQVLHYDGAGWTVETVEMGNDRKLAVTPSHLWVIDSQGAIFHRTR